MTCTALLYTNSDIDVPLQIKDLVFESTDVVDLIVDLEQKSGGTITRTYSISNGKITRNVNDFVMSIAKEDITISGKYKIKIIMIDSDDKHRGITPCSSVGPGNDCLEFVNA